MRTNTVKSMHFNTLMMAVPGLLFVTFNFEYYQTLFSFIRLAIWTTYMCVLMMCFELLFNYALDGGEPGGAALYIKTIKIIKILMITEIILTLILYN